MNISKISTNTNFKGYKNIISQTLSEPNNSFSFMTMELDNLMGVNDLEKWHSIQKSLMYNREPSNYITFQNLKFMGKDFFMVNDLLLNINEQKNLSPTKENVLVKLYLLIESLTKRIANTDYHPEDSKKYLSLVETIKHFTPMLGSQKTAEIYATKLATQKMHHNKTADFIHEKVAKELSIFLSKAL